MASSPTVPHFPASSPSRDSPNSHPYSIKTSSSAVLTRSNSAGYRDSTSHHYVPLSPAKNSLRVKKSRYVPTHRHTRSTSSTNEDIFARPPPVPLPPSVSVPVHLANRRPFLGDDQAVSDGEGIPPTPPMTWRMKRSETMPSVFPSRSDSEISIQDLPENPKDWTPSQLSIYLSSSLRLKGDVKLPLPVTRDIAAFVIKEHLSGRAFLRMTREDYEKLGINRLWQDSLLDASRMLRQSAVQGRIMGFGAGSPLSPELMDGVPEQDLEDSPSADPPSYSPLLELSHRRVPVQWEKDKRRQGFRAGRVRGIVETYERSVSESSAGSSESDGEDSVMPTTASQESARELEHEHVNENAATGASEGDGEANDDSDAPSGVESSAAPSAPAPVLDDAPSIEELLREQEEMGLQGRQYQSWGAKAWEDEVENPHGMHITAKRIPPDEHHHSTVQRVPPAEWQNTMPRSTGEAAPRTTLADIFEQPAPDVSHSPRNLQNIAEQPVEPDPAAHAPDSQLVTAFEAFQRRLELIEQRLDELERKEAERETAAELEALAEKQRQTDSYASVIGRYIPRAFDAPDRDEREGTAKNYNEADPSISGLPKYMFLISLGVVSVVTRVVFRRVIGDRNKT